MILSVAVKLFKKILTADKTLLTWIPQFQKVYELGVFIEYIWFSFDEYDKYVVGLYVVYLGVCVKWVLVKQGS